MEERKETRQELWQKRNGYISKTYKLKKEIVEEFKTTCDKVKRSQAEVLSEFMQKFIDDNKSPN